MHESETRTPRSFIALVVLVVLSAVITLALGWHAYPPYLSMQLVLAVAAAAFSGLFSVEFPAFSLSLSYTMAMSLIVLGGPAAAGIAAASSSVTVDEVRRGKPPLVMLFNAGQMVLSSCLGGFVYVALGGRVLATGPGAFQVLTSSDFPRALVGMSAAAVVVPVANFSLASLGVAIYQRVRFRDVFGPAWAILPTQSALGFLGFLMAQALAVSVIALPLFIFPLVVAQQLYQRYLGLRAAYADTVRSLVGALEAKDPYTRGHSERVAAYAVELGQKLNLDARACERLEYAALLHDLGKLRLARGLLTKPGALSSEERAAIASHPVKGAEMVSRIPQLKDLASPVRQHHERVDGTGYPGEVGGGGILLEARILAVADSYDAMTTTRAYRPAMTHDLAVAELIAGAGTQFDADLVGEFIQAQIGLEPEVTLLGAPAEDAGSNGDVTIAPQALTGES